MIQHIIIVIIFLAMTVFINTDGVGISCNRYNVTQSAYIKDLRKNPAELTDNISHTSNPPQQILNPPGLSKITDRIWISDYRTSTNYEILKSHGIKQILSVGSELPAHKTNDFKLMHIRITDEPEVNISKYFDSTYKFIDAAPTLVHCAAGISRSVSNVLAYLIRKERMPLTQAIAFVKSKRSIIRPNPGFLKQLEEFEKVYVY
jgi:protein-tyrosine phosphatase